MINNTIDLLQINNKLPHVKDRGYRRYSYQNY